MGGLERLSPQSLSAWAFLIHGYDIAKALRLSTLALSRNARDSKIIENHLSLLSMTAPQEAVTFYRLHKNEIETDVGWFAATRCLLQTEQLDEAHACILLAEKNAPDVLNKLFLAEILCRLQRHSEAWGVCVYCMHRCNLGTHSARTWASARFAFQ